MYHLLLIWKCYFLFQLEENSTTEMSRRGQNKYDSRRGMEGNFYHMVLQIIWALFTSKPPGDKSKGVSETFTRFSAIPWTVTTNWVNCFCRIKRLVVKIEIMHGSQVELKRKKCFIFCCHTNLCCHFLGPLTSLSKVFTWYESRKIKNCH